MRIVDPFGDLGQRSADVDALRRELDRLFGDGQRGARQPGFLPGRSARNYPLINLAVDKDNVYVEALAPGLDPEKIELEFVRQDFCRKRFSRAAWSGKKPAQAQAAI